MLNKNIYCPKHLIDRCRVSLSLKSCLVEQLKKLFNRTKLFLILQSKIVCFKYKEVILSININSPCFFNSYNKYQKLAILSYIIIKQNFSFCKLYKFFCISYRTLNVYNYIIKLAKRAYKLKLYSSFFFVFYLFIPLIFVI